MTGGCTVRDTRPPRVCIVIVHWGPAEDTCECLKSLGAITYPNAYVIVVDNGPQQGGLFALKDASPRLEVLASPRNLGFGGGANLGITRALVDGADYVLLLNNDTVVAPDFLAPLVERCESDAHVGIVGPKVYYFGTHRLYSAGGWPRRLLPMLVRQLHVVGTDESDGEVVSAPQRAGYIWGQAMLIRREVFERVGLFDTNFFMYCEDCDLCRRAAAAGFDLCFVPQSRVWHRVAVGTRGNEWRRWRYYVASIHTFHRKYSRLGVPQALAQTALTMAGIMLTELWKGNVRWLGYPLAEIGRCLKRMLGRE
jgi:GT2 family glycosyltransferase